MRWLLSRKSWRVRCKCSVAKTSTWKIWWLNSASRSSSMSNYCRVMRVSRMVLHSSPQKRVKPKKTAPQAESSSTTAVFPHKRPKTWRCAITLVGDFFRGHRTPSKQAMGYRFKSSRWANRSTKLPQRSRCQSDHLTIRADTMSKVSLRISKWRGPLSSTIEPSLIWRIA